jgi:glycosyltransferase involved in cell wall biosynthesis
MSARRRVVFLANNVEELGGAQRVVHTLAQGLAERGHEVTTVGIVPAPDARNLQNEGLQSYRQITLLDEPLPPPLPGSGMRTRLGRAFRTRQAERQQMRERAVAELGNVLADGPPGIVISAQVWAMEHLREVPKRQFDARAWRIIGQYHASYRAAASGRDLVRLQRSYAEVDVVTALCDEDRRAFIAAGLPHTITMTNPIASWPVHQADGQAHRVVFLGRLAVEKGPLVLLDAWSRIARMHPTWELLIYGSGPQAEQVARRAAELPRVTVMQPVAEPEAALQGAAVHVLPSLSEGSPLALVEAMATGLACVATNCSAGVRDLVDPGVNGLLVRTGDPMQLGTALGQVFSDEGLRQRLGDAARESVSDRKLAATLDRWEHLMDEVWR